MVGFFQMLRKKKEVRLFQDEPLFTINRGFVAVILFHLHLFVICYHSNIFFLFLFPFQLIPLIGFMAFAAAGATSAAFYFLFTKTDVM